MQKTKLERVLSLQDFFLCTFREDDSDDLKLGAFLTKDSPIYEIEFYPGFKIETLAADGQRAALLLIKNEKEERLLCYEFIRSFQLFNLQTLCEMDRERGKIFEIGFDQGRPAYKLRQNYRTKRLPSAGEKEKSGDRKDLFVDPKESYAILYNPKQAPSIDRISSKERDHLHIVLSDFSDLNFESCDFLQDYCDAIMKIERNFSDVYRRIDRELIAKKLLKTIKEYFEEQETYRSLSISGLGHSALVAIPLAKKMQEDEAFSEIKLSSLILEDAPGDWMSYRYASPAGREIPFQYYRSSFENSLIREMSDFSLPVFFIANKNEAYEYEQSLLLYRACRYLNKDCQILLPDDSEKAAKRREKEILQWIQETR